MRYRAWWPAKVGDERVSGWFAIIPVKLGTEVRWLEWVNVRWMCCLVTRFLPPCEPRAKWVKQSFVNGCDGEPNARD